MAWPVWLPDLLLYYLPLAFAAGACLYHGAVAAAALRFRSEREPVSPYTPPVSVLKPLRGIEPHFYQTLAGFFRQQYPHYEIVFGLSDENDPARWTIAQLQRDFPAVPVKLVVVPQSEAANPKLGKLQRMIEAARHETFVISDADIAVAPDYLREVVRPLAEQRVGMVTCLYRGVPSRGVRSVLEALGMSAEFAGQVLLGRALNGMTFGLGSTMATRKQPVAA
ncbi:MAG TPA: glycosyltransferase, partial [Terriglobia bacterium]|nr:glycosyltransferase [Terriglobia bacterium]